MKGKVAVMTEPMKMTFAEYDLPEVEPNSVLVKVIRTNVCGTELHIWQGHHPIKKSGVMGHEMVGKIEVLGPGVETDYAGNKLKIGDRVAATYFLTCRKCNACQRGDFYLCENVYRYFAAEAEEFPHFHGSFGTHYYIHPNQYFYKVPDNVPDSAAASANCALSQVYFGIEKASLHYGETIVIQGAGGLGLNASAVAKEFGATVIVIDGVKSRLEKAKLFGADYLIDMNEYTTVQERAKRVLELTDGNGADVGMELTGVPDAFSEGIHHIRTCGRFVCMGNVSPGHFTSFDPGLLTRKSITVIPANRYNPWYLDKALQFLSRTIDKYPFGEMLDAEFTLSEIKDALDKSARREVTRASIVINE